MKKKFVGLDLLRFGLAVYLMMFHTIHDYPQLKLLPFNELLGMGGVATSSFFIMSGFILAHVYFGNSSDTLRGGTRDFLMKRLTNLYPIHIIALLLFVVVVLGGGGARLDTYSWLSMTDLSNPASVLGPVELAFNRLLALLMLDTWNPLYITLNPPAWSLSVLFFFYLCFPWLAPRLLSTPHPRRWMFITWVVYLIPPVIAGAMAWMGPPAAGIVTTNPIMRLPEFMAGILFYNMYRSGGLRAITDVKGWKFYTLAFCAVCFAGEAALIAHGAPIWLYIVHNGGMLPAELALLLVAAQSMENSSVFVTRWSARLGNAALSIFAVHLTVFFVFIKVQKFFGAGMSPLECLHQRSACLTAYKAAVPALGGYPLYLLATVVVALFFQEVLVVKMRDALRRRFTSQASSTSVPAKVDSVPPASAR